MSTRPSALVVDSYGTLLDWTHVASALAGVVAEPHRFLALWRRKQLEYTWLETAAERFEPFAEVTRRALRHTALVHETEIPERIQRELVETWSTVPVYPDVPDALARLARVQVLVVLSNGSDDSSRRALERAGILRHFRHVLSPEHASAYKPSPRVYALPLPLIPAERGTVLYVTGNAWDAAGAQLFGYRVVRLDRRSELDETIAPRPELVLRNLTELADWLAPGTLSRAG